MMSVISAYRFGTRFIGAEGVSLKSIKYPTRPPGLSYQFTHPEDGTKVHSVLMQAPELKGVPIAHFYNLPVDAFVSLIQVPDAVDQQPTFELYNVPLAPVYNVYSQNPQNRQAFRPLTLKPETAKQILDILRERRGQGCPLLERTLMQWHFKDSAEDVAPQRFVWSAVLAKAFA